MTRVIASLLLLVAVLAHGACGPRGDDARPVQQGPAPVPVVTGRVERKAMPLTISAIGRVEPISTVAVRARVGGELTRVWFAEGDSVTRGQTLFTIDERPFQAALAEVEARLARNKALIAKAEADVARYAGLVKQDYVTKEQYDGIVTNLAAMKAQIAADTAAVDTARLNLAYCTIAAPVSGRTGNLLIKAGNLVRANDERAMVTINQMRPIYVSFTVPAQYLASIQQRRPSGLAVTAVVPERPDEPFTGRLTFVDNAVDAATSTVLLKGTFENPSEALWPGQFVSTLLSLGVETDRVVAPASAIQTGQQGTYVFVVKDDGTAEMRVVKVNRQDAREAVVDSGLEGRETVVVEGHLRVVPGARVRAQPAAQAGPPAAAPVPTPAAEGRR
jgi:multidrug efflux system membrane fusion protein